jgi:drug/metabolite transporter (DMT)-like permease
MLSRLSPVALAALGVLLLSAMDATIKHIAEGHSVLAILFGRYLFGMAAAAIWNSAGRPTITGEMLRAHAFRGCLIVVVAGAFFYALSVLPLAEAITIAFVAPLLIPFFAWAVVGERPRPTSLAAGVIGFAGAIVAMQGAPPEIAQSREHTQGVIAVLVSAAAYAWAIALLRTRADKDGAPSVGLLQTAIPCLIVAGPAIALSPMPPLMDLPWFALMGTLGAGGWYMLIVAYGRAEAQRLAPLEFTALIWATAFGYFFFAEVPRPPVFAGAALIIGACLFAEWSERRFATPPAAPRRR